MKQSKESSITEQYTKGMVLSYIVLATALVKSEVITVEDVIKELDVYINIFTERYPESVAIIETMKMVKNTISELLSSNITSETPPFTWLSNFIGNA